MISLVALLAGVDAVTRVLESEGLTDSVSRRVAIAAAENHMWSGESIIGAMTEVLQAYRVGGLKIENADVPYLAWHAGQAWRDAVREGRAHV